MLLRLSVLILLVFPVPSFAQALTAAETTAIDSVVRKTLGDTGVPSASIAVVRDGKVVFAKAYGKMSPSIPVADASKPYQIASISKQFTAAAVLMLEDRKQLRLDDHVSRYLAGITGGDRITIRQLLSHTSGLQDYWPQDYSFKAMATAVTPGQIIDRWAKKPLDFEPGTAWQYSNTGYVVAGLIVEKVSAEPLLTFLQKNIFRPLGITAIDQDRAVGPAYPQGYKRFALGPVRPETPPAPGWLFAAGELSMSAADLAKWDVARIDRTLLPADDWQAQETPVILADGSSSGYGLGVTIGTTNGRPSIEHSGEAVGFLSETIVYPQDRAAIVVLTNAWFSDAYKRIANGIAHIILPVPQESEADQDALASARRLFAQLQGGTLDRAALTDDANFYFTPVALADYRTSLSPLGSPREFVQTGTVRLRGGYVNRRYRLMFPGRTLSLSTYAEPGDNGRFEQYIVAPTE